METSTNDQKFTFISEESGSKLYFATQAKNPKIKFSYKKGGEKIEEELELESFIDVKGWKALGNKLGKFKILKVQDLTPAKEVSEVSGSEDDQENIEKKTAASEKTPDPKAVNEKEKEEPKDERSSSNGRKDDDKYSPGDTIELDL